MKTQTLFAEHYAQPVQSMAACSSNAAVIFGGRQHLRAVEMQPDGSLATLRTVTQKSNLSITAVVTHPFKLDVSVAAASNGELTMWNYRQLNYTPVYQKWQAHERTVTSMCFLETDMGSPRDDLMARLVTASADGTVMLWSLSGSIDRSSTWPRNRDDGQLIREGSSRSGARDVAVKKESSNGKDFSMLVAGEDGQVELFRLVDSECILVDKFPVSTQPVNSVRFFRENDKLFATGSRDAMIRIYDMRMTANTSALSFKSPSSVWCVRWRPTSKGEGFLSSCQSVLDPAVYVWDLRFTHTPSHVFNSHTDTVSDMCWVDEHHILSCAKDGDVHLSRLNDAIIPIEKMRVVNVAFSMRSTASVSSKQTNTSHALTSVLDSVDRTNFERNHGRLRVEDIINRGYPPQHSFFSYRPPSAKPSVVEPSPPAQGHSASQGRRKCTVTNLSASLFSDANLLSRTSLALTRFLKTLTSGAVSQQIVGSELEFLIAEVTALVGRDLGQLKLLQLVQWMATAKERACGDWLKLTLTNALSQYKMKNNLFMCLVIGAVILGLNDADLKTVITREQFAKWCGNYVDFLKRLELFCDATNFIKSSHFQDISDLSHRGTLMKLSCTSCGEECACPSSQCAVCGDDVEGLWLSCGICGHGGHLRHLNEWFASGNATCPAGCGHACLNSLG